VSEPAIKLIASDMDGTLLDEKGRLPEETFELIRELRKKGVMFCASSGRRYATLRHFFDPVKDDIDYVAALGTLVYAGGMALDREVFSTMAVQDLFTTCEMFDSLHLAVYDESHSYLVDTEDAYLRELDKDLPNATQIYDPPSPDFNIIKASVYCDDINQCVDMAYVLERELSKWFNFLPSGSHWIDVTPRHVSKATGVAQLLRYYGIGPENVLAFGDSMNDYALLRYAGQAYVMDNARDALKQVATKVIGPNSEHAVQKCMAELLESL
jgi:Cof subfamily protein (haloacid dehalogenase superfamily)